jgi:hypothetical protein
MTSATFTGGADLDAVEGKFSVVFEGIVQEVRN